MNYLFICLANACRSQLAEAYFNSLKLTGKKAQSCGLSSHPIQSATLEILKNKNIACESLSSKRIDETLIRQADVIVLLDKSLKSVLKLPASKNVIEHHIADPVISVKTPQEQESFTKAFDEIKDFIDKLLLY